MRLCTCARAKVHGSGDDNRLDDPQQNFGYNVGDTYPMEGDLRRNQILNFHNNLNGSLNRIIVEFYTITL